MWSCMIVTERRHTVNLVEIHAFVQEEISAQTEVPMTFRYLPQDRCRQSSQTTFFQLHLLELPHGKIRNSTNGHVATAGGVQEMELNELTKHCSARCESRSRSVTVAGSG